MIQVSDRRRVLFGPDGQPIVRAGYDAVETTTRRRPPSTILRDEDLELPDSKRRSMISTARDLRRNFSIAGWAIRKHLDYVSTFTFQSRTGDAALDIRIEALIEDWSRRENCEITGRHPLHRLTRILEGHRVVDGDVFVLRLADGRLQAIEGDRVRTPYSGLPGSAPLTLTHGVQTDAAGRALAYCVCKRVGSGFAFERMLPAKWVYHHGYFDRLDQVRGVTPLSSALNDFRDCYDIKDYALAKIKISQLFGLIFYREAAEEMGVTSGVADDGEKAQYKVDFGKGPFKLELQPGDKAEWLESRTPAAETHAFWQAMIEAALKSLDLPMSFYDGSKTNFFGSRGELNHYMAGAKIKRQENRDLLSYHTRWKLRMWIEDGRLALPAKMAVEDIPYQWVHAGLPWWNPVQEVSADVMAVAAGMTSRQRRCLERGEDWFEIVDELATEQKTLREKGLPTDVDPSNVKIVEITGDKRGKDENGDE